MRTTITGMVLLVGVVGCAGPEPDAPVATGEGRFTLVADTAGHLEATYTLADSSLRLTVTESTPNVADVTFDFGDDTVVAFHLDYQRGVGDFLPSGAVLDVVHRRLVDALAEGLERELPPSDQRSLVEEAAMRQASYMQIVPEGEQLAPFTFYSAQGWVSISCTCGNQYIGAGYYRTAGRGCSCTGGSGNGCKGRCGQGCGITSTPYCTGSTAYTQDCARHDYGLASFSTASDDYSFAPNNCSCSGVGTCY